MSTGKPLLVFCLGKESWLQDQVITRLKRETLAPGFEETDGARFEGSSEMAQSILEAVRTAPFGPGRRLIVIEGLDQLSEKALPWLKKYLTQPNPKTCLVIRARKMGGEKPFLSAAGKFSNQVRVIPCQELKGPALKDWVLEQARGLGKSMEPAAAVLLITRKGTDLQALKQALESLVLFTDEVNRITLADVEALSAPALHETAFEILDAAGAGRPEAALEAFREALALGYLSVEQFLGALGWYYRMIWKTKRGGPVNTWGSPERKTALTRLTRWPEQRLSKALEEVLQADWDIKTGKPHPELVIDQLLLKLAVWN